MMKRPFNQAAHLAKRERLDKLKSLRNDFFAYCAQDKAQKIQDILDKYPTAVAWKDKHDFASTGLHHAVFNLAKTSIIILLARGANPNAFSRIGYSPFNRAAGHSSLEMLTIFCSFGTDVDVPNKSGTTPLHTAILNRRLESALFLLSKGADVNRTDSDGDTALTLAENNESLTDVAAEIRRIQARQIEEDIARGRSGNEKIITATRLKLTKPTILSA